MQSTIHPTSIRNGYFGQKLQRSGTRNSDPAHSSGNRQPVSVKTNKTSASSISHVDECLDPNCLDREQLRQLQTSLDHFTDYENYERCCDRHHNGKIHYKPCGGDVCMNDTRREVSPCGALIDDCDACIEEHADCYEEIEVCDDDCEHCEEECEEEGHEPDECPQDHPTTKDNCIDSFGMPLPLLGPTCDFDLNIQNFCGSSDILRDVTPCTDDCIVPMQQLPDMTQINISEPVFDTELDHWQTFIQKHHCAPDPCIVGQVSQPPQHVDPSFGFTFGCDPSMSGNQYPWQHAMTQCTVPFQPLHQMSNTTMPNTIPTKSSQIDSKSASQSSQPTSSTSTLATPRKPSDRVCQWLMPCGSICGTTYTRTEDLKKHVKNSHSTKGTTTCRWQSCTSSFATEAALTGHISKKHLSFNDEEGPWKCTIPSCSKSFMYKQVRDEHVASHNGGNKMHCPICHQWLNAEGSNFRRHMASHNPKNEHMKCRFEGLGCRRRFPRLDNLRRHEGCCKFGKKAAGVHHHHHRVHVGHGGIS